VCNWLGVRACVLPRRHNVQINLIQHFPVVDIFLGVLMKFINSVGQNVLEHVHGCKSNFHWLE